MHAEKANPAAVRLQERTTIRILAASWRMCSPLLACTMGMCARRSAASPSYSCIIYPGRGASIGRLLALVIWTENMSHMSKYVKYVYSS